MTKQRRLSSSRNALDDVNGAFSYVNGRDGSCFVSAHGSQSMELSQVDDNVADIIASAQLGKDDLLEEFRHLM